MIRPNGVGLALAAAAAVSAALLGGCSTQFQSEATPAALRAYRLQTTELHVGDGVITVAAAPPSLTVAPTALRGWVEDAADAVSTYYGRFPVQKVRIVIESSGGQGPQSGTTFSGPTPVIRISVGRKSADDDLGNDWMLTHEMVHLGFPRLPRAHHWLEEGLATYVEPIARAQAGQIDAREVWKELVHGLPFGLPQGTEGGLDGTHSWGRIYWGGALFCLLADIQIREQTQNRFGLQDALRGVVDAGGTVEVVWPMERTLATADRSVGVGVLQPLYDRMRSAPVNIDLDELWERLGVRVEGGQVTFDEEAPLAGVRRAITGRRIPASRMYNREDT